MYVKKTLLFAAHILRDNEIGFMDTCFLSGFNIKEDVFITRGLYFRLLDIALMCIHVNPFLTTITFPGVALMVVCVDLVSVSVYQFKAFFAFKPFLTYCFQVMIKAFLGFESSVAIIAMTSFYRTVCTVTKT